MDGMPEIIVIAHNIRSTHNVGSIFRTCEGFGISCLFLTGYSPYPLLANDQRLPHLAAKLTAQIHKTALGAETTLPFAVHPLPPFERLHADGFTILGLEQDPRAVPLNEFRVPDKVALLIGEEVAGIETSLRKSCDALIEIPMRGQKESFNVSVATGIALYGLMFGS